MFQAFIVLCTVGVEPAFDTCILQVQPTVLPTQRECVESIDYHLIRLEKTKILDSFEIHNIGCHSYLLGDKKVEL